MTNEKAWVTLATNDTYSLGALVLAHSLKKVNTSFKLVVLITSNVSYSMRGLLQSLYDEVKEVNLLDSGDTANLRLLARPELGVTFTKLHCWKLRQYEKCVFLDADTLVLQNCDELFEREELSAAPDVGWPDCFNSGVFVLKPSEETYESLVTFALTHGSFDGGDQGLLNMYFSDWATGDSRKRLPFLYNLSSAAIYSYLPAFKQYGKGVKIVHFIGGSKPWLQPFNSVTRLVQTDHNTSHLNNFLQYWWDLFTIQVHPRLSPEMSGLAYSLSQIKLDEPTPEQLAQEDSQRRLNWEQGIIDYMGRDSFDNIWNKITQSISQTEPSSDALVHDDGAPATIVFPSSAPAVNAEPSQELAPSVSETPISQLKTVSSSSIVEPETTKSRPPTESSSSDTKVIVKTEKEVESPVPASNLQFKSAPSCEKPTVLAAQNNPPEKQACAKESVIPQLPLQKAKLPAESASITQTPPKLPQSPTVAAPGLSKETAVAGVQLSTLSSISAESKSSASGKDISLAHAKAESESVQVKSAPAEALAQETKSKQVTKSGGDKKK